MRLFVMGRSAYAATAERPHDPAAPSVLFVHGAGMDHTIWALPKRYFVRQRCNAYAVDLPGHGRSDAPPLASIEAIADWLVQFLDAAGVERAAVVGHSMGSLAALDMAARYPRRVRSLALLGTGAPMAVAEPLLQAAAADSHAALDMVNIWGHSRRAQLGGNPNPGMWMTGVTLRLLERAAPGVLHADLLACNSYADGLTRAAQLACPVLLLVGDKDAMTPPRVAGAILAAIPHACMVTLQGSGHSMLAEQPDRVLDALIEIVLDP